MPAVVSEQWTEYKYVRGESASRTFYVTGVDDQNDAIDAVAAAPTSAGYGSRLPLDSRLFVSLGAIDVSRRGYIFVVGVTYGTEGGFTFEPDPLDERWRCSVDFAEQDEPIERTWDGRPILNSNLEPLQNPISALFTSVLIQMWRWESAYNLALALTYKDKINLDAVTLPKLGTAAAGELICRQIKPLDEFESDSTIIKVGYVFEARPLIAYDDGTLHGFHRRQMDLGHFAHATKSGSFYLPIIDLATKETVQYPVRLNGLGVPLDATAYGIADTSFTVFNRAAIFPLQTDTNAVFQLIDESRGGIAFSGLQIAANL